MAEGKYELVRLEVSGGVGDGVVPRAMVRLSCPDGEIREKTCDIGVGMTDCAFRAIDILVGRRYRLASYKVVAHQKQVNQGSAAPGTCGLTLRNGGPFPLGGEAVDQEIVVASVRAYLDAINKIEAEKSTSLAPQTAEV